MRSDVNILNRARVPSVLIEISTDNAGHPTFSGMSISSHEVGLVVFPKYPREERASRGDRAPFQLPRR